MSHNVIVFLKQKKFILIEGVNRTNKKYISNDKIKIRRMS